MPPVTTPPRPPVTGIAPMPPQSAPPRRGVFQSGPQQGWFWQIDPDPSNPGGYVRRVWNPSNPAQTQTTPYDYSFELQNAADTQAQQQAYWTWHDQREQQEIDRLEPYRANQNKYRDVLYNEGVRQYDKTLHETEQARLARREEVRNALREQQRQYDLGYGLNLRTADRADASLGLQTLQAGAAMRGPLDFVQGDQFAQGVSGAGFSPFVAALGGGPVKYGGGTATTGHPTPLTVGTLANAMGGGTGGTDQYGRPALSPGVQQAVNAGSQAYQGGLANKPLGWMESMTDSQRQGLHSIGGYLGRDVNAEDEYYRRSRPGQGGAFRA